MSELLIKASTNGQIEEVRKLLREGAADDYANQNGDTALIAAVSNGRTEIVELLLDEEADVKNNRHCFR
jgi:ankyrin repeat protein